MAGRSEPVIRSCDVWGPRRATCSHREYSHTVASAPTAPTLLLLCTTDVHTPAQEQHAGSKHTLLLAVDINVGVVCWWMFPGHCNEAVFNICLTYFLFPALQAQSGNTARYIM